MPRTPDPPSTDVLGADEDHGGCFQAFLYRVASPILCLDADFNILFFSPASTSLLNIRAMDIGRPLADLNIAGLGERFFDDAAHVLAHGDFLECRVTGPDLRSYRRCIANFNAPGFARPGISITFADVSEAQQLASDLDQTRLDADISRSRHLDVLAGLSHDLRQPLQTMKLLQALLAEALQDQPALRLAEQLGETLSEMSGMFNGLLSKASTVSAGVTALCPAPCAETLPDSMPSTPPSSADHRGIILIVEDDAQLLKLLGSLLRGQGYEVALALNSAAALSWIYHSGLKPDLILADLHLGTDMNGLQLIATLRSQFRLGLPAIVLTGDVSGTTAQAVAAAGCTQLNKPAKLKELVHLVHSMFARSGHEQSMRRESAETPSVIFVVDDDQVMRDTVRQILQAEGYEVRDFASGEGFLHDYSLQERACLLLEARLPDGDGINVLRTLRQQGDLMPTLVISASSDIAIAVAAMKAGAWDFIEKPCDRKEMLHSIERALGRSQQNHRTMAGRQGAIDYIATLTARQRQIMDMVLAGHPSKNIAAELGISQRTVENHRASIMTRTHSRSIPALARLALAANLQISTTV